jgi:long-chain acyl-CoA synthetase
MISSGGPRNTAPGTLTQLFFDALARYDKPNALQVKVRGEYQPISSRTVADRVRRLAMGLQEMGIAPGDRVAIFSENRPEWAIADYACLTASLTDVPLYPNLPPEQAAYILRDAGAVAIFVSDEEQAAKIAQVRHEIPALRQVITFAAERHAGADLTITEVEQKGAAVDDEDRRKRYRDHALTVKPDDVATLIYTSGTTGDPKGVMLTHGNIASNVTTSVGLFDFGEGDECLSFLPLSHIFERMFGHYSMFHAGVVINYAGSIDTVAADMQELRPTMMASVPRLYEKIFSRVLDAVRASPAPRRRIFAWARRVGESWVERTLAGQPVPAMLSLQRRMADRLVFATLRARTGGRIRFFISGGAPLSPEIAKFFFAAGMPILEGYGLTETSPVMAVNIFGHTRLGTVGRPIPGVEIQIAPDGEILTRGPNVMRGYFEKPDATAAVIDPDGWFHTGDIGMLDADGYLKITDRKKDLIVTAGGKNIAPQPIENLAKSSRFVSNAVMLGDRRPFPIMLVVPNADLLKAWAARHGLPANEMDRLCGLPEVHTKLEREVRKTLRDLAQFEMPKKFLLLPTDFSVEGGELTPTLKVRRRVVEERHKVAIEALYAEPHQA